MHVFYWVCARSLSFSSRMWHTCSFSLFLNRFSSTLSIFTFLCVCLLCSCSLCCDSLSSFPLFGIVLFSRPPFFFLFVCFVLPRRHETTSALKNHPSLCLTSARLSFICSALGCLFSRNDSDQFAGFRSCSLWEHEALHSFFYFFFFLCLRSYSHSMSVFREGVVWGDADVCVCVCD